MAGLCPLPFERTLQNYGPGIRTWQLALPLARAGHEVYLVGMTTPESYEGNAPVREETRDGLVIERLSPSEFLAPGGMSERIRVLRPEVLVGATIYGSFALAQAERDLPFWADQFGHVMAEAQAKAADEGENWPLAHFWRMVVPVAQRADRLSVVSERQRYAAVGELGALGRLNAATCGYEFTAVIPCAAVPSEEARRVPVIRGVKVPADAFLVLWSGSFNVWSDPRTLIDGVERAMDVDPRVHFVCTGGGIRGHSEETYRHLVERVSRSAHRDRLHLEGWVRSDLVPSYTAEADVGVLTERSMYEGQLGSKNRIVQWMASGLPAVYNHVGDLGDLLAQGLGLTFAAGNASALADRILWAARHPEELRSIAARAREVAQRDLSFEATTGELQAWAAAPGRAPDAGEARVLMPWRGGSAVNSEPRTHSRARQLLGRALRATRSRIGRLIGLGLLGGASLTGCGQERPSGLRGVVLVSFDTLRADRLGAYGYLRPTSPFFDSLAARGTLFETAVVQLPGTLPSHMSIFTGLYPAEHGVYPPDRRLSPRLKTLPEVFRAHGFRTGGFTEGGYMEGDYGFARGFDRFNARNPVTDGPTGMVKSPEVVRQTFAQGLKFLAELGHGDRFFLFLHTYAVHDPYSPPEPYRGLFWTGPRPDVFPPTGPELERVNRGSRPLGAEGLRYFSALYDAQVRWADDELRTLWKGLERLGLDDQVVTVLTADHGEEFQEHGQLLHEQVYFETLHVPLLILEPGQTTGRRVRDLVQSIDIAPTLFDLAGVPAAARPRVSGRSLVPLVGRSGGDGLREGYAEAWGKLDRTLLQQTGGQLRQYVHVQPAREEGGTWVSRSVTFDGAGETVLHLSGFHVPRQVEARLEGRPFRTLLVRPDQWAQLPLPRSASPTRVTLTSTDCDSPRAVGAGTDTRCLSFQVRGTALARGELYDLTVDPRGSRDLSRERPQLAQEMLDRLVRLQWSPLAPPELRTLSREAQEGLRALGYLQ